MQLDVRIPMGWLFLALGIILIGYGLISDKIIYETHSLGLNVNLAWGAVLAIFGGCTLLLARKKNT